MIFVSPESSIAFYILNFPVRWYGIFISSAMLAGVICCYFFMKKYEKDNISDVFVDFAPFLIIFSILGARLFYVVGEFDYYFKNPLEIFLINHGGLSIFGAIIFGILVTILFCKKNKINNSKFFDYIALFMPLSQAIGRWGNYFNQEAYGAPTNGFLKLFVDVQYRIPEFQNFNYFHPTFLYESFCDFIIFLVLMFVFFKFKTRKDGFIFYLYLILYSFVRFFMEFVRVDSVLNFGVLTIAQIISLVIFIVCTILITRLIKIKK